MSNETFEFTRILIYILLAFLLFDLGIIVRAAQLSLFAIALQFITRGMLLFYQIVSPSTYRELNNFISTPSILLVLIAVFINLWILRRD